MSETSEEKTKRRFITNYNNDYFTTQISIFYLHSYDGLKALKHKLTVTNLVRRTYPEQCFLYRLCLTTTDTKHLDDLRDTQPSQGEVLMGYHTFFTNNKIDSERLTRALNKRLDGSVRVTQRLLSGRKKLFYTSSFKKGELHDLHSYFGITGQIKRLSTLNKKHLPPK